MRIKMQSLIDVEFDLKSPNEMPLAPFATAPIDAPKTVRTIGRVPFCVVRPNCISERSARRSGIAQVEIRSKG